MAIGMIVLLYNVDVNVRIFHRSNIVTEDISKLFVKRQQAESGSQ